MNNHELTEKLVAYTESVKPILPMISGCESTKTAIVLPFLMALGWNVFSPKEVQAWGGEDGIDYALLDNEGTVKVTITCDDVKNTLYISEHDRDRCANMLGQKGLNALFMHMWTTGTQYYIAYRQDNADKSVLNTYVTFDILNLPENLAEMLAPLTKEGINSKGWQSDFYVNKESHKRLVKYFKNFIEGEDAETTNALSAIITGNKAVVLSHELIASAVIDAMSEIVSEYAVANNVEKSVETVENTETDNGKTHYVPRISVDKRKLAVAVKDKITERMTNKTLKETKANTEETEGKSKNKKRVEVKQRGRLLPINFAPNSVCVIDLSAAGQMSEWGLSEIVEYLACYLDETLNNCVDDMLPLEFVDYFDKRYADLNTNEGIVINSEFLSVLKLYALTRYFELDSAEIQDAVIKRYTENKANLNMVSLLPNEAPMLYVTSIDGEKLDDTAILKARDKLDYIAEYIFALAEIFVAKMFNTSEFNEDVWYSNTNLFVRCALWFMLYQEDYLFILPDETVPIVVDKITAKTYNTAVDCAEHNEKTVDVEDNADTEETVDVEDNTATEDTANTEDSANTEDTVDVEDNTDTEDTVDVEDNTDTEDSANTEENTLGLTGLNAITEQVAEELEKEVTLDTEKAEKISETVREKLSELKNNGVLGKDTAVIEVAETVTPAPRFSYTAEELAKLPNNLECYSDGDLPMWGVYFANCFIVKKGSKIAKSYDKALESKKPIYLDIWRELRKNCDSNDCLKRDYEFTDATFAATVCRGTQTQGYTFWKVEVLDITLAEYIAQG